MFTSVTTFSTQPPPGFDGNAAAFLLAANITNITSSNAINDLVVGLKNDDLWNKFYALYPFVGDSANTNKFNLKNPSNIDGAFRLTFTGSWIHNSNGITGNGIDTSANTFFDINTNAVTNDFHMSIYSRTNISLSPPLPTGQLQIDMGVFVSPNESAIIPKTEHNKFSGYLGPQPAQPYNENAPGIFSQRSDGFFMVNRKLDTTGSTNLARSTPGFPPASYDNITSVHTKPSGLPITIGSENRSGGPFSVSTKNLAFSSIGLGLTLTEMQDFYDHIQTFQTALGRAV